MNAATALLVIKTVDFVLAGWQMSAVARARMDETKALLEAAIAEGRDITPAELADLNAALDDALARLDAADDRLGGGA